MPKRKDKEMKQVKLVTRLVSAIKSLEKARQVENATGKQVKAIKEIIRTELNQLEKVRRLENKAAKRVEAAKEIIRAELPKIVQ